MKRILILSTLLLAGLIYMNAATEKIKFKSKEVEFSFTKITVQKLAFHNHDFVEVKYEEKDKVTITKEDGVLKITAPMQAKITLKIPEDKSYVLTKQEKSVCRFDVNQLVFTGPQNELIELKNGNLTILVEDGEQKVEINQNGIFVTGNDEKVEVSSQGIIVQSEDENTMLTGFWGRLLGKSIRSITNLTFRMIAKDSATFAMHLLNSNDENKSTYSKTFSTHSEFTTNFQTTYQGKNDLTIHVENRIGSISIEPWGENYVNVEAIIRAEKEESDLEKVEIAVWGSKSGDVCHVETKELVHKVQVAVNYKIQIPQKAKIGSIKTVTGNLTVNNSQGQLDLKTTNGNIYLSDIEGIVSCVTTNGNISLKNVNTIKNINATNGNIHAEISSIQKETFISTTNGNIYVTFLQPLNAEIDVSAKLGIIATNNLIFSEKKEGKQYCKGILGKGGDMLVISTSTGNINVNDKNVKE